MSRFTIMGCRGFIGSAIRTRLQAMGHECHCPEKGSEIDQSRNLGRVIYAIGLTADFRTRPFDTVEAHVCKLSQVLKDCKMDSLLYLSSARIYGWSGENSTAEDADITVNPGNPSDLYNLSKALGESIALASGQNVKIARLSNVYGKDFESDNFLTQIIKEAVESGHLLLRSALDSEKDYISVDDAAEILINIALHGREKIYNVASGFNTSHKVLADRLRQTTGCTIEVDDNSPLISFPTISTERIDREFKLGNRRAILDDFEDLIRLYENSMRKNHENTN